VGQAKGDLSGYTVKKVRLKAYFLLTPAELSDSIRQTADMV